MYRLARTVLRFVYYYTRLVGMLPFIYDFQRNRICKTRFTTNYNAFVQLLMFAVLPIFIACNIYDLTQSTCINPLHQIVAIVLISLRYCTLLVSIYQSWRHCLEFVRFLNDWHCLWYRHFQHLYMADVALQTTHKRWIVRKFFTTVLADILIMSLFVFGLWHYGGTLHLISIMLVQWLSSLLNVVMWYYYNAVLIIEMHFRLLITKLKTLVLDSFYHSGDQLSLAAELHELLIMYYRVHRMIDKINKMYRFQGGCILFTLYMNNIALGYMIYSYFKYGSELLFFSTTSWLLFILTIVAYYCDLLLFLRALFSALTLGARCQHIIEEALTLPNLNLIIYKELTIYKLQHAVYPVELNMIGIFKFCRSLAFSFFASATLNAIVLIQYDYQHSNTNEMN